MSTHLGSRPQLKVRLMGCGAALALATSLIVTGAAVAQDDADTTTVVVTGIKKGIQDAIVAKKRSTEIVEAISAEDIGKLPDASIAESIARLPGIAAQRTNGRAQSLSVRGLGPDFTVTTLNGREQVSTNDGRGVEFDQYPSELISQVVVYKTPSATMPTTGIAGTADLRTVRPLAYGKRAAGLVLRKETNDKGALIGGSSATGSRFALTYIDQFFDKKLGVAVGYAKTNSPTQVERWEAWGYSNPAYLGGNTIMDGAKPEVASSNLDREGLMAVVEWKPNDKLHLTLDAYKSTFDETQLRNRLELPLFNPANSGTLGVPGWDGSTRLTSYTATNGFVTSANYSGIKSVIGAYVTQREAELNSIGLNGTYKLGDSWTLEADISSGKVEREDLILETNAGTGLNGSGALDTVTVTQTGRTGATFRTNIDYTNFNTILLTDPRGWGGGMQAGYIKNPTVVDEISAIKLAASRQLDMPVLSKVSFGLNRTERSKSKRGNEGRLVIGAGNVAVAVPNAYRLGITDLSFIGVTGIISYDALGLYNDGFYNYQRNVDANAIKNTWSVDETVDVAFVKFDIESNFMGVPVTGNFGVQSQTADQSAESIYTGGTATGVGNIITGGAKYTDILPSLNLSFAVMDDAQLRFAYAKTLTRPRMDEMSSGFSYGTCTQPCATVSTGSTTTNYYWSGGGGNAELEPWRATSFDISFEKYFGRKGYFALAAFHKDLDSFIFDARYLYDFSDPRFNPSTGTPPPPGAPRRGFVGSKINGEGGYIKGLEASLSLPGEIVTPMLDGFGVVMSASQNESEVKPDGTTAIAVPGLSEKVINSTVYYEKHGFSTRVSSRYRGDFIGEVFDYQNNAELRWIGEETVVDAQISYQFQNGPAKGLTLLLQGNNLTDEAFKQYDGNANGKFDTNVLKHESYGSSYILGINYRW